MSDFRLNVSLYTPAGDIILGGFSNYEALFGRGGNDTFYGEASGSSNNQTQNIDFWFGDIFDNSPQEYEIILNIQQGNPLLILERNIPSVGADRFILGDEYQPYYTNSGTPDTLLTTNFLGLNEYVVIYDFDPTHDLIRLNGTAEDYRLVNINGLKVEGVEQLFYGKAIFSVQQGLPDLVAYVISKPEQQLDLKGEYFDFIGKKPTKKPESKKLSQLGTTGIDFSTAADADAAGNVYITGYTTGPMAGTNQGSTDIWVAKYDNLGKQLWMKQFGSANSDQAYSVVTDKQGNFYLAGDTGGSLFSTKQSTELDIWVAKYDSNGNQLWGKQFGVDVTAGYSNSSFGLDIDSSGNVYLSGLSIKENTRTDIFDFSIQDDSWIAKFDNNGNQQWFTQLGQNTPLGNFVFDETYDVTVDKDGNSYAAGWTQGLVQESDPSRDLLKYDAWLTKVKPNGEVEWVRQFGSTNEGVEVAWAVDTDSKGNIYAVGWTSGDIGTDPTKVKTIEDSDIWLAKFRPDGTLEWTKQFGTTGNDGTYLADIDIDAKDNIFITGNSTPKADKKTAKQTTNAFIAKFDTSGTNHWYQELGSETKVTYASGLTADDTGKLFVTGFTDAYLGTTTTSSNGTSVDSWVAILDAQKGDVLKFDGLAKDVVGTTNPGSISTIDLTNNIVVNELLPSGDNTINPDAGLDKNYNPFSYGQFTSNLGEIFSPTTQNSFASVLSEGVTSGNASFLSSEDLQFLKG